MSGVKIPTDRFEQLYRSKRARGESSWSPGLTERETIPRFLKVLLEAAALPTGATVLELGCGAGDLSFYLESLGPRVTGVDCAPTAVLMAREQAARRGSDVAFIVSDVLSLPQMGLEGVDAVIDGLCLHSVIGDDRASFFQVARRLLRPAGALLLMTMCGPPRQPKLQAGYDHRNGTVSFQGRAELHLGQPNELLEEVRLATLHIEFTRVIEGDDRTGDQDMLLCVARSAG